MSKPEYGKDYNEYDQMIVSAARLINNSDVIYTGVGFPIEAAVLAKNLHAPDCTVFLENGIIRSSMFQLPWTTDTMESQLLAEQLTGLTYVNCVAQAGHISLGMMGGGQVDRYGNVNDHVVGNYHAPVHRWMGSGGANDLMSFCGRTMVILKQTKQRFPEKVDFITCPGYLDGKPNQRGEAGLPPDNGPSAVITQLGIFTFEEREMTLSSYYAVCGVTVEKVKEELGWDVRVSNNLSVTEPPTNEELTAYKTKIVEARRQVNAGYDPKTALSQPSK